MAHGGAAGHELGVVRCGVSGGAVVAIGGRRLMLMLAARGGVAWCAEVRVLMLMLLMLMRMILLLKVSGVVSMVLLWAEKRLLR